MCNAATPVCLQESLEKGWSLCSNCQHASVRTASLEWEAVLEKKIPFPLLHKSAFPTLSLVLFSSERKDLKGNIMHHLRTMLTAHLSAHQKPQESAVSSFVRLPLARCSSPIPQVLQSTQIVPVPLQLLSLRAEETDHRIEKLQVCKSTKVSIARN